MKDDKSENVIIAIAISLLIILMVVITVVTFKTSESPVKEIENNKYSLIYNIRI